MRTTLQSRGLGVSRFIGGVVAVSIVFGAAGFATAGVSATPVGNPSWAPVDAHIVSFAIGGPPNFDELFANFGAILPPPHHQPHPQLGIGPGTAHPGPYDHEIADGIAATNFHESMTFDLPEMSGANGITLVFMVVPLPGGAIGRTPDSLEGPMIPNALFPFTGPTRSFVDGMSFSDDFPLSVPPLDNSLNPSFPNIDGHSHFPFFLTDGEVFAHPGVSPIGLHEYRIGMRDQLENGWDISATFRVVPEPAGLTLLAAAFLIRRFVRR